MKENQKPNKRWYLWLVVAFPILGVFLLGGDIVRDMVVLPVEYRLWQAIESIKTVPQYIFWAIFIGISLIFIIHSLISGNKQLVHLEEEEVPSNKVERVEFWTNQIRMMHGGNFSRVRFAEFFSKLILDIIIYTGEIDLTTYENELQAGQLDLPNELLIYLKTRSMQLYELRSPNLFARIKNGITGLGKSEKPTKAQKSNISQNSSIDPDFLVSVNYLEKELEVNNNQNENR